MSVRSVGIKLDSRSATSSSIYPRVAPARGLGLGILVARAVGCLLELWVFRFQVGHGTHCKNPDRIVRWLFVLLTMDFLVVRGNVVDLLWLVAGSNAVCIVLPAGSIITLLLGVPIRIVAIIRTRLHRGRIPGINSRRCRHPNNVSHNCKFTVPSM